MENKKKTQSHFNRVTLNSVKPANYLYFGSPITDYVSDIF